MRSFPTALPSLRRIRAPLASTWLLAIVVSVLFQPCHPAAAQATRTLEDEVIELLEVRHRAKNGAAEKDPCVSEPAETRAAIEKAGLVLHKQEHLKGHPELYVLIFEKTGPALTARRDMAPTGFE